MREPILLAVAAGLFITPCARHQPDNMAVQANDIAVENDFNGGSVLTNDHGSADITTVPTDETAGNRNAAADDENGTAAADTGG